MVSTFFDNQYWESRLLPTLPQGDISISRGQHSRGMVSLLSKGTWYLKNRTTYPKLSLSSNDATVVWEYKATTAHYWLLFFVCRNSGVWKLKQWMQHYAKNAVFFCDHGSVYNARTVTWTTKKADIFPLPSTARSPQHREVPQAKEIFKLGVFCDKVAIEHGEIKLKYSPYLETTVQLLGWFQIILVRWVRIQMAVDYRRNGSCLLFRCLREYRRYGLFEVGFVSSFLGTYSVLRFKNEWTILDFHKFSLFQFYTLLIAIWCLFYRDFVRKEPNDFCFSG